MRGYRQERQGPGAARNFGVNQASGDYVAFLDSDDLWYPWALATYAAVAEDFGRPGLLLGSVVEFAGVRAPDIDQADPVNAIGFSNYLDAVTSGGRRFGSGLIAVRRDAFQKAGGFDTALPCAEDHDWALRLSNDDRCAAIATPLQIAYRRHEVSATHQLPQMLDGVTSIVQREIGGKYPGGLPHQTRRRIAVLNMAIPVSIAALGPDGGRAWALYRAMAPWCLSTGRWKYLLGFPVLALRQTVAAWRAR